jgi:hypothetical protein
MSILCDDQPYFSQLALMTSHILILWLSYHSPPPPMTVMRVERGGGGGGGQKPSYPHHEGGGPASLLRPRTCSLLLPPPTLTGNSISFRGRMEFGRGNESLPPPPTPPPPTTVKPPIQSSDKNVPFMYLFAPQNDDIKKNLARNNKTSLLLEIVA